MRTLHITSPHFAEQLGTLLASRAESQQSVVPIVADIIAQIRQGGDAKLKEFTAKFDQYEPVDLRLSADTWQAEAAKCPADVAKALELSAKRIVAYSKQQLPANHTYTDSEGVELGWQWTPVDSAGLYVPGGLASYPSSVLMNAVPAKVAGVKRLAVTVPCPDGILNPVVLKACEIAGVDEIYAIGGAQAVAALAYGTETIQPVDMICGPGNAFVAEAKRQVFGQVGIDMIAGPSEVLIVADASTPAKWVAMDMLAQAEHDERAQSIVIVDDADYAEQVSQAVAEVLKTLPRAEVASQSIDDFGAVIVVEDIYQDAAAINDRVAPEHLQLAVEKPEIIAEQVTHAGAIFFGAMTTEAMGDYIAGPSHVLPTGGTARYASGLSVFSFLKRSSTIRTPAAAFNTLAPDAIRLADAEGLGAHASSMRVRLDDA